MSVGYIKLHRSLLEWQYWDDHNTTRLLIYFLVSVNYEPKKWMGIQINAGSFVTSYDRISQATKMTQSQIRRSMKILISENQISQKTTNKFQLVSLIKWDELQLGENKTTNKQQSNNNQTTIKQQQLKNTKNNKKERITNQLSLISVRKNEFKESLRPFLSKYGSELLNDFFGYWTEPNHSNTKMKFELQKTWSIERRLNTWVKNDKNYNSQKTTFQNANRKPTIEEAQQQQLDRILKNAGQLFNGQEPTDDNERFEDVDFQNC